MKGREVLHSSNSDEWSTPQFVYDWLNAIYTFTLDPCATEENHKCDKFYTIETDGLKQSWSNETVFVNPPYSDIKNWVKKANDECIYNSAHVVLLIPSRTDTSYWHDFIMPSAKHIYFLRGRLKFGDSTNSAPFPSCIVDFEHFRAVEKHLSSFPTDTISYSVNIKLIKEKYDRSNR